jgi:hypothetical protein
LPLDLTSSVRLPTYRCGAPLSRPHLKKNRARTGHNRRYDHEHRAMENASEMNHFRGPACVIAPHHLRRLRTLSFRAAKNGSSTSKEPWRSPREGSCRGSIAARVEARAAGQYCDSGVRKAVIADPRAAFTRIDVAARSHSRRVSAIPLQIHPGAVTRAGSRRADSVGSSDLVLWPPAGLSGVSV